MANALGITIDNVHYSVFVKYDSLKRSFEIVEGNNRGKSINHQIIRDIFGTTYDYNMTFTRDPEHPEDYDRLYEVITAPVSNHRVILPYGQTTIAFAAYIENGSDTYKGMSGDTKIWDDLTIIFKAIKPQRV